MKNPEIMLKELNSALRRLRGACTDLGDEDIDSKLLEVMRRLLLAEILGNTWIVAIGGSQGAGKTALISSLYDCEDWLPSNEGRGEKMPVLIIEKDGIEVPMGFVRRLIQDKETGMFSVSDEQAEDYSEFQQAMYDPNVEDLLPILHVPSRYFKRENQAWLLLPGYEKQDRENQSWQNLMRQALIAAGGCIVVTDATRMANSQQQEIVKDMLDNELRNCAPLIVISKTERLRDNPVEQAELRASAQATFQVNAELAERNIILTGTDDPEYVKEWMPRLRDAIDDLNFTGQSDRYNQINNLSNIVGKDLTRILNAIRSKSRLYFNSDKNDVGDGSQVLECVLENFDEAAETLRIEHSKCVNELIGNMHARATKELDERLKNEHEGVVNWLRDAFDTTTQTKQNMQKLVQNAWHKTAPDFFSNYSSSLSKLTIGKLGKRSPEANSIEVSEIRLPSGKLKKLVDLGYIHDSGKPVQFSAWNAEVARDIKILLGNSKDEVEDQHQAASKQLGAHVQLIPAMSLEYSRLLYALPEASGLQPDFTPINESFNASVVVDGVKSLEAGVDLGRTAMKSLATVMAIDVATDGDSDILATILGGAESSVPVDGESTVPAPMPIHPAAVAATAVVAVGYLSAVAVTRLRTFERKAAAQAHDMLTNIRDHHTAHLSAQFDETMRVARERVKKKMRERYRMDESLMRKDRLAKAIADVESITSDLRNALDSSAAGLQVFIADREI